MKELKNSDSNLPLPLLPLFDLGRTHDFVLHRFEQQRLPLAKQSESVLHFGEHVFTCDASGHSSAAAAAQYLY